MPELNSISTNGAAAPESSQNNTQSSGVESGDLATTFDFFQGGEAQPQSLDNNDPNVDADSVEPPSREMGSEDSSPEDGDEAPEEGDESEESKSDTAEEKEEDSSEGEGEEEKKAGKSIGVNIDGKDYDVPLDATLPVTVNGEIEQATVQDLINAYSSKSNIRKELEIAKIAKQELTEHRRRMLRDIEKREIGVIEKEFAIEKGRAALKEGRLEDALNEFFDYDPDVFDKLDEVFENFYSQLAKLPPDTKRALQLDRRNKLFRAKQEIAKQSQKIQESVESFNAYKKTRCEQVGLTESEVEDAWDSIGERAKSGEIPQSQIQWLNSATPQQKWDTAMSEALATKTRAKITDVLKKEFPKLENKISSIIGDLEEKLSGKFLINASKEDIAKIISRDYNDNKPGKTGGKVAPTNSLRDKAQPRHKLREAAAQNDDEDLYAQDKRGEPTSQVWGGQFQNRPY